MKLGYTKLQLVLEVLSAVLILVILVFLVISWGACPTGSPRTSTRRARSTPGAARRRFCSCRSSPS